MTVAFVMVSGLEKSIRSIFVIGLILLVRRRLNINSTKWASIILWTILFIYLLFPYSLFIQVDDPSKYGLLQLILMPMIFFSKVAVFILECCGDILDRANRTIVASLFLIYFVVQLIKRNKAMKNSILMEQNKQIKKYMDLFNLKRKVQVFINDDISTPITYGVIHPKIILQSHILKDEQLLKYVIIHEMTHIKKFDIMFNHIKNLITCLHWFNIFILVASRYIEDDIEALCDKLVIQKVGDTIQNRKDYCLSMLKLIEQNQKSNDMVLKLNPTKERIIIMKKWKKSFSGVCVLVLATALSMTVFADVIIAEKDRVIVSDVIEDEVNEEVISQDRIYEKDKVKEISDEEYDKLTLGDIQLDEVGLANIDDEAMLSGLEHKSYAFNMILWKETNHDSFTVKVNEVSCRKGVKYMIIIQEYGNDIYQENFSGSKTLTVKANNNSNYTVIINNQSTSSLDYRIRINSYKR